MKAKKIGPLGGVQGDVPIIAVENQSENGKATKQRIVAYGEQTGHHHEIRGECEVFEVERNIANQLFVGLEVIVAPEKEVEIFHKSNGEHDTIQLMPGVWFIPTDIQQVEYDGAKERRVTD